MPPTISPWEFWRATLKSPRYILAPMVDASELPWRLLSRRYATDLAYTPMLHAPTFVRDARYRRENLASCAEDRPLIVQFCANDPDIFLQAAQLAVGHCDAVDLNLGCPQTIAKRGHYGAFLQDEWDLVAKMVQLVHKELTIPITCKVRIFEDINKTIEYAQLLEKSGCYALTVHGRTRDQKGPLTGLASWKHIKAVKEAVKIPVIANGNIQYLADVERCIEMTGVDAVMTAEGNLTNPALFAGTQPLVWDVAQEYLELTNEYPCPLSYIRGHLFKMFHHCLSWDKSLHLREVLAKGSTPEELKTVVDNLKELYLPYQSGAQEWSPPADHSLAKLPFPPWQCQPYVRLPPEEHVEKMKNIATQMKRAREEAGDNQQDPPQGGLSKKKLKKLAKNPNKQFRVGREVLQICNACPNPMGVKCKYSLCKTCCKSKCYTDNLNCEGHGIMIQLRRQYAQEKARATENGEKVEKVENVKTDVLA